MPDGTHVPEAAKRRVIVVGGGISGLAIAFELISAQKERGAIPMEVLLLESGPRLGGNIRTEKDAGYVCEWGPEGFLDNVPATLDLIRRLGIEDRMVRARPEANRRYIQARGKLRQVPLGPASFLLSDILPFGARLRVLCEFIAPAKKDDADESVHDFASRRIGHRAAETLVDAMVAGVYAGDARSLSLPSAFPRMREMEKQHGSLTRAMIDLARRRRTAGGPAGPKGALRSFDGGMETLIHALASAVGPERVRLDSPVKTLERIPDEGWNARFESGGAIHADAVIVTTPAHAASRLLDALSARLASRLAEIPYAGIAVVAWGWETADISRRMDGFGYLIPRAEGLTSLGALWSSSAFERRAPAGKSLLRIMVGGARHPEAVGMSDAELRGLCLREVGPVMGLEGTPAWERIFRFPRGIAQYNVGHQDRLHRIALELAELPGLFLAGTAYKGIAINSACAAAPNVSAAVLDYLRTGNSGGQLF